MIEVVVDDLAFVGADAVVRPTTTDLKPLTAALRRLEQIGGSSFRNQLNVHEQLEIGAAVVTSAGDLAADFVVHAVIMSAVEPITVGGVRRALTSVIHRASDWHLSRLAVPPLGVGAGNLTLEDSAELMIQTLRKCLVKTTFPRHVSIVVESEEARLIFEARLNRSCS